MAEFALMLALAQADAIDYSMHQGQELYHANMCSLYTDETLFSAEAATLQEQENILALEAKLQKVEKDFKKTTDSSKTALQKSGGCTSGANTQGNNSTRKKAKPAWMLKKLSDEDVHNNKVKTVNGKEYFWCTHHKCYGHHKTAQCKKKGITPTAPQNANASNASTNNNNNNNNTNGQLHLSSALSAIAQE